MSTYTVAQMIAVLSADSSKLDSRLSAVEDDLNELRKVADKVSDAMTQSFTKSAEGVGKLEDSTKNAERALANMAEYEYASGKKSVQEYRNFLNDRMASHKAYENEWRSASMALVRLEKENQQKITADLAAELRTRNAMQSAAGIVRSGSDWKKILLGTQYSQQYRAATDANATPQQQAAAAEKLLAITQQQKAEEVRLEEEAAKQRATALGNLAKFEYEQGNLSVEAYRTFLQRRMQAFGEYTAEWKAASIQLLALDREQQAAAAAANKEFMTQRLTAIRAEREAEVAANAEANALMQIDNAAFLKSVQAQAVQIAEAHQEAAAAARGKVSAGFSGAGNVAAGITGIELASGAMYGGFEQKTVAVANNSIMTNEQLQEMRRNVLQMGKETGTQFDDLANAFMRVTSEGYKGAEALNILKIGNMEAVSTGAKAEDTVNDLATSLRVFNFEGGRAANVMNVLDQAAAKGNSTLAQWVQNTGQANAIAGAYGGSMTDVNAAMSALTRHGIKIAEADTQIKNLINHLVNPQPEVKKALALLEEPIKKKYGVDLQYDFSQRGYQDKGIYGILGDIQKITATKTFKKGNAEDEHLFGLLNDLSKATGVSAEIVNGKFVPAMRGGLSAMLLMTKAAKDFHDILEVLNKEMAGRGQNPVQVGFDRMMDTYNQKWKAFTQTVEADFMPVGERAMALFIQWEPTIKRGVDLVLSLMEAFQKLPKPIQQAVTVIGGLVVLQKLTGMLVALKVPVAFSASLRVVSLLLNGIGEGTVKGVGSMTALRTALLAASEGTTPLATGLAGIAAAALPIAGVTAALVALGVELYYLKGAYDEMVSAEDQATASAKQFANMQKNVAASGEKGALSVSLQQIAQTLSGRETAKTNYLAQLANVQSNRAKGLPDDTNVKELQSKLDAVNVDIAVLKGDRLRQESRLHDLNREGAGYNPSNPIGKGGSLGLAVAKAADTITGAQDNFSGHCERLAEAIRANSGVHLKVIDHLGSARQDALAMAKAGMMIPYTKNMTMFPGDQLYSTTLGRERDKKGNYHTYGHVMTVNSAGEYVDQHGVTKAPRWGSQNYQLVYRPDSVTGGSAARSGGQQDGITPAYLEQLEAEAKAKKEAAKAAEALIKARDRSYTLELRSLEKIVSVTKQKQSLDTQMHKESVEFDLSSQGKLYGIHGARAQALRQAAIAADTAEHGKFISDAISKANSKSVISSLPEDRQKAIELIGGDIQQWRALGNGASVVQKQILDAIHRYDWATEVQRESKALADLNLQLAVVGDEAKKAAIQSVAGGSAEKWSKLSDSQKQTSIDAQRQVLIGNRLLELQAEWANKAAEAMPAVKTNAEAAERAIQSLTQKYGDAVKDPKWQEFIGMIRSNGRAADQFSTNNFFTQQQEEFDARNKKFNSSQKNQGKDYSARDLAIATWEEANQKQIDGINKLTGLYGFLARIRLKVWEYQIGEQGEQEHIKTLTTELTQSTKDLKAETDKYIVGLTSLGATAGQRAVDEWVAGNQRTIKSLGETSTAIMDYENNLRKFADDKATADLYSKVGGGLADAMRQAYDLNTNDPFEKWLNSYRELHKEVDANGNVTYTLGLPTGTDIGLMSSVYKQIEKFQQQAKLSDMMHQATEGLTSSIMGGIQVGFSPDSQKRGSLQTQLLSQQQELLQYQIAQKQFQSQYPGDPNDPYITRLKMLQEEIGKTQSQINSMGNSLWKAFSRTFGSIFDGFRQTLNKMAMEYMQSQLMHYLTRQIGTGSSFSGKGGASNVLGSVIGGIFGILGGGGGGGSTPSSPDLYDMHMYAKGTPRVPGPIGAGDIVPALLSPGEAVIPAAIASNGGGMGTTIIHNNTMVQNITTPDIQGFRQSDKSRAQDVQRFFRR